MKYVATVNGEEKIYIVPDDAVLVTEEQEQKLEQEQQIKELKRSIGELKRNLRLTDYQAIKFAEGEMGAEEYAPIKEQRRQWRAEINALEIELANAE